MQASKLILDDTGDHLVIGKPRLDGRSGEARVVADAGIYIDLEDEGRARRVDAEVDARIAVDPEQIPTGDGKPVQLGGKLRLVPLEPNSARRTDKRLTAGGPFGVVIGDQRFAVIETLEHGFADRQQLDPAGRSIMAEANSRPSI